MNIYDLITSNEIATYWDENTRNAEPYFGETLFPNRKQLGIDLKWIKGRSGVPVVLRPSAFDVHVIPRVREAFDQMRATMPFFKESYYIDEELRQSLLLLQGSNNAAYVMTVLERVFDDVGTLLRAAAVARERMRMGVITSGVLAFAANGQAFEFDYNLLPEQMMNATTAAWTDPATATPLADIQAAVDYLEANTDSAPARLLMNRYTFNLMRATDEVRNGALGVSLVVNPNGFVARDAIVEYVQSMTGLEIVVYDKTFRDENEVVQKFVPDGVVTVLPAGTLGYTWFGTTPEEADLMGSPNVANVSIVDTGVAITTMVKPDPVSVETKVSQVVMPSFEAADNIVIIDVLAVAAPGA